ncbi:MAG: HAD family phosphatase [Calditrichia bacterium]
MIKGILFDFDGVIVRSMEDHYEGWKRVFKDYDVDLRPHDLFLLEGQGVELVAAQMMEKYNIPMDQLDRIIQTKKIIYEEIKDLQIYPGLKEILDYLKQKNYRIGVVTGGDKKRVLNTLNHFSLTDYFSCIITADDVTHTKPHPEPFIKGAEALGLSPEECLVVENAPLGVESARKAGCKVAAITHTLSKDHLKNADWIIDKFEELKEIL